MDHCEFHNVEILDGYFSGVIYIYSGHERYILDFGYDVELKSLHLSNCSNLMYSDGSSYTLEEIANIRTDNYYIIQPEMDLYLATHPDIVFADSEMGS